MTEPTMPTIDAAEPPPALRQWEQIALELEAPVPADEIEGTLADPAQAVQDALIAVSHARDVVTQREVLARVYAHLAEQAIARGRRPAPKFSEGASGRRD